MNQTNKKEELISIIEDVKGDAEEIVQKLKNYRSDLTDDERDRKWKNFFSKLATFGVLGVSSIFASWEMSSYFYEQRQLEQEAEKYFHAAKDVFYKQNNPSVALSFVNRALEFNDDSNYRFFKTYVEGLATVRTLMNLDRPYSKKELNNAHQLIAEADILQDINPDSEKPYILKGLVYTSLKELDKAVIELSKAIEINSKNSYAHIRYGVALMMNNDENKAINEFNIAIKLDNNKWAHFWLGTLEMEINKKPLVARKHYAKALELDKKFDLAHYNIAWTYLKEKKYASAKKHFQEALIINPSYKEAYYGMGMLYGYQNIYKVAEIYFTKAIKQDGQYLTAYKWRGIVNDEMGNYKNALSDFKKAITIDPEDSDLYIRRAHVYASIKDRKNAKKDLEHALSISKNSKKITKLIASLK